MISRIHRSAATRTTDGNDTSPLPSRFVRPTAQSCSRSLRRIRMIRSFVKVFPFFSTLSRAPSSETSQDPGYGRRPEIPGGFPCRKQAHEAGTGLAIFFRIGGWNPCRIELDDVIDLFIPDLVIDHIVGNFLSGSANVLHRFRAASRACLLISRGSLPSGNSTRMMFATLNASGSFRGSSSAAPVLRTGKMRLPPYSAICFAAALLISERRCEPNQRSRVVRAAAMKSCTGPRARI